MDGQIPNNLVPDEKGVTVCPTSSGGRKWESPTYDPDTHMYYFRAMDDCAIFTVHPESLSRRENCGTRVENGDRRAIPKRQPSSPLTWIRSNTSGAIIWSAAPGHGPASCRTATGLLAYGDDDGNFVMVDAKTDKPLWHFSMGEQIYASPMSYAVNGKQYFAIGDGTGEVFAFGLP